MVYFFHIVRQILAKLTNVKKCGEIHRLTFKITKLLGANVAMTPTIGVRLG